MNNYPAGVTDNDPYFTDESEIENVEPNCPQCGGLPSEHLYKGRRVCVDEQERLSRRSQATCVTCSVTFTDTETESALGQLAAHGERFH